MKHIVFVLFIILTAPQLIYSSDADVEKELVSILNQLLDSVAAGKTDVWEKYLADTCVFNDENGKTHSKKELLADFQPLPPGYSGNLKVEEAKSYIYGDTAILSARELENMEIFGQKITARYLQTTTFVRKDKGWQIVAAQITAINNDPPSTSVSADTLKKYAGRYRLGPDEYMLTVENGKLIAQRTGRDKEELLAETDDVFFRKGSPRTRILFTNEAMLFRREGIDVVWKRM
jgi:hypothetical protein